MLAGRVYSIEPDEVSSGENSVCRTNDAETTFHPGKHTFGRMNVAGAFHPVKIAYAGHTWLRQRFIRGSIPLDG